jgi:hypothetical protein
MTDLTTVSETPSNAAPNWLISLFIMLVILVANGALIVGLLQLLSWTQCVLLIVTGISLSGGLLYTVVTMHKLGKPE